MIPHIANFYWNRETPLSYLRLLTLITFRYHHPDWKIRLWTSESNTANVWNGNLEQQDFQQKGGKDYISEAQYYGVETVPFDDPLTKQLAPNFISDIMRFRTIDGGGWFFDLDQVFVRNFDDLCDCDFILGAYNDVMYCGVVGASEKSKAPLIIRKYQEGSILGRLSQYNGLGILLLRAILHHPAFIEGTAGEHHMMLPHPYFYPVFESARVRQIYDGMLVLPVSEVNYAIHWYGGHPLSQKFNAGYTEDFARTSDDSISVYIRNEVII